MIFVDSSVWIDYFRGRVTRQTDRLHELLDAEALAIGDLVLLEVLQGFADERSFATARELLTSLMVVDVGGQQIAVRAAAHHRTLRARGVTIRKTIDTLIATRCIVDGYTLLHSDRDFEPFVKHLGLRSVF